MTYLDFNNNYVSRAVFKVIEQRHVELKLRDVLEMFSTVYRTATGILNF